VTGERSLGLFGGSQEFLGCGLIRLFSGIHHHDEELGGAVCEEIPKLKSTKGEK